MDLTAEVAGFGLSRQGSGDGSEVDYGGRGGGETMLDCASLTFSGHALQRMFARGISVSEIRTVIARGEPIAEYPDDQPFPSALLLCVVEERPLHVVVAREPGTQRCVVVTAYEPQREQWDAGFRTRRLK